MSNNHYTKKADCRLERIIASFGGCPIRWPEVEAQFNDKRHKRSQRSAASLQTRWRTLQKKAKQESLKRIAQKDGFEAWFVRFFVSVEKLREELRAAKAKIDELNKANRVLEKERDDAVKAFEVHLEKDERMRSKVKKLGEAALVVNSD